ncbi:putative FKBP-type peptidyl-prolyl cis-trans isomerase FkpA precursor [compost metagenome]
MQSNDNKKKGLEFLAKNKTNPKVKTTASGLQYEVLQEGDGKTKPKASDVVQVKYTGKLLDGTVFDSTDKSGGAPADISLDRVIKGWTEGIQLMSKGSKYRFYIPSDLAYGDQGAGDAIPGGSTIIFDVELVNIK